MKGLLAAAIAAVGLTGCVAIPAPVHADAYYYGAPTVGIHAGHGYHHPHRYHHRHGYRHHGHGRHHHWHGRHW